MEAATAAPAVQITEIIMPITAIQIMETPTTETPTTETLTMEIPTTVIPATTIQTMATIPTMEITSQTRIKQFCKAGSDKTDRVKFPWLVDHGSI